MFISHAVFLFQKQYLLFKVHCQSFAGMINQNSERSLHGVSPSLYNLSLNCFLQIYLLINIKSQKPLPLAFCYYSIRIPNEQIQIFSKIQEYFCERLYIDILNRIFCLVLNFLFCYDIIKHSLQRIF